MGNYINNRGFSLIEILFALLIGILLLSITIGLFVNNKRVYREHDASARLQENMRFAVNLLVKDIRIAGNIGCIRNFDSLYNNITTTATDLLRYTADNAIEGFDGTEGSPVWHPSGATIGSVYKSAKYSGTDNSAGTDGITLRYIRPLGIKVSANTTGTDIPATFKFNNSSSDTYIKLKEAAAVIGCDSTDIFYPTKYRASGGLSHGGITGSYDSSAEFARFIAVRYYIRAATDADGDGTNDPALWRTVWDPASSATIDQELIEGVEDMEIMYGVDSNDDNHPNSFLNANAVATNGGWANVVAVRFALQFRTNAENPSIPADNNTYSLLGKKKTGPISDHRRRRIVTMTVQIRNRIDRG